jgi:hypothetical protein
MKYFPVPVGPPTGTQICRNFPAKTFSSEFVTSNFFFRIDAEYFIEASFSSSLRAVKDTMAKFYYFIP